MNVGRFRKSGKKEQKDFSVTEMRKALQAFEKKKNMPPQTFRTLGKHASQNPRKGKD
jgi:hypothetical protein